MATFYSFTDGNVGDYVDVFLTNGGLFDFNSVDFATVLAGNSANSDEVAILGLVSGNPVEVLNITESSIPFLTIYPDFSQPVDRLRVLLTANLTDAMLFDNFNLTPTVPLPATLPLFAIAMASFAWTRRRTKTQA